MKSKNNLTKFKVEFKHEKTGEIRKYSVYSQTDVCLYEWIDRQIAYWKTKKDSGWTGKIEGAFEVKIHPYFA